MTPEEATVLTAGLGMLGTLLAVALTHLLLRGSEKGRREADDVRRWHEERFRVLRELIGIAVAMDRDVRMLGLILDQIGGIEKSEAKLPPFSDPEQIMTLPRHNKETLVETLRAIDERMDRVPGLLGEINMLTSNENILTYAQRVVDATTRAVSEMRDFRTWDDIGPIRAELKESREALAEASRSLLHTE